MDRRVWVPQESWAVFWANCGTSWTCNQDSLGILRSYPLSIIPVTWGHVRSHIRLNNRHHMSCLIHKNRHQLHNLLLWCLATKATDYLGILYSPWGFFGYQSLKSSEPVQMSRDYCPAIAESISWPGPWIDSDELKTILKPTKMRSATMIYL